MVESKKEDKIEGNEVRSNEDQRLIQESQITNTHISHSRMYPAQSHSSTWWRLPNFCERAPHRHAVPLHFSVSLD